MDVGAVTVSRVRSLNHQFSPDFNEIDFENDFDAVWDWYDKRNQKLTLSRIKVVYQKYDNHARVSRPHHTEYVLYVQLYYYYYIIYFKCSNPTSVG